MFVETSKRCSDALYRLFQPMNFTIAPEAIIEGSTKGRIWVDNEDTPTIAVLWNLADGIYIVTPTHLKSHEKQLQKLLNDIIIPAGRKTMEDPVFVIYSIPSSLNTTILSAFEGWRYSFEVAYFMNSGDAINSNILEINQDYYSDLVYTVENIDSSLVSQSNLGNIELVKEEIAENWPSFEDFYQNGLGSCIVDHEAESVISWAIIGNIARSCAEIGIETADDYRQYGFGTAVAKHLMAKCHLNGLVPHWYCFRKNYASVLMADLLGFQEIQDFLVILIEQPPLN